MAGYCNQNGTLGPPNVSSSIHPEAKVVNHNVVSLELEKFAGTSSPYHGCILPSLLTIPELWVYWGESVVISPGLARFLRYEGLDSGPSPGPCSGPMSDHIKSSTGSIATKPLPEWHSEDFHCCLRTTRRADVIEFKGISKTEKAAEVVNNLSFEGEKGLAVMISGGR